MKRFQKVILAIATITLIGLLWKIDPAVVWHYLTQVGWGLTVIFAQEIVAHCLNAAGWRYAFSDGDGDTYPFTELLRLRIAGDGVNYLTPSATIAGEFIRAVSLNHSQSSEVRYASVAVAKFSQALAQAFFILSGLVFMILTVNPIVQRHPSVIYGFGTALALALCVLAVTCGVVWRRISPGGRLLGTASALPPVEIDARDRAKGRTPCAQPESRKTWISALGNVPRQCLGFCARHPWRFTASTACFMMGYAWGAFEAYWICRFLGVPVSPGTALIIEALSNFIDGLMFMVPAKVGTQEAGKTLIFAGLGLPTGAGFAFGVVRHVRELVWAGAGLLLCTLHRKTSLTEISRPEPIPIISR